MSPCKHEDLEHQTNQGLARVMLLGDSGQSGAMLPLGDFPKPTSQELSVDLEIPRGGSPEGRILGAVPQGCTFPGCGSNPGSLTSWAVWVQAVLFEHAS